MTRRRALGLLSTGPVILAPKSRAAVPAPGIPKGPFAGTRESLRSYRVPEWFRDAKLGLWLWMGRGPAQRKSAVYGAGSCGAVRVIAISNNGIINASR